MVEPMSPRLTSSTTSAPASRASRTVRSSTAMPAAPKRSKNADCGFTTAASVAERRDAGQRETLEPGRVVGQSPVPQQGRVRVDADAQRASRGKRLRPGAPRMSPARPAASSGSGSVHTATGIRRRALVLGVRWRVPNRVAKGGELAVGQRALQLGQHPHRGAGSPNTAVPTDTADAPARMNCSASSPVRMPPMPRIGRCGRAGGPARRTARRPGGWPGRTVRR